MEYISITCTIKNGAMDVYKEIRTHSAWVHTTHFAKNKANHIEALAGCVNQGNMHTKGPHLHSVENMASMAYLLRFPWILEL